MVSLRPGLHANQGDKPEKRLTYPNVVDMLHDEEDDQGERLINEGMKRPPEMKMLFSMLTSKKKKRVQDMEEEQPFSVRHDSRASRNFELSPKISI